MTGNLPTGCEATLHAVSGQQGTSFVELVDHDSVLKPNASSQEKKKITWKGADFCEPPG